MNPKYDPKNIIQETKSRNPDMPATFDTDLKTAMSKMPVQKPVVDQKTLTDKTNQALNIKPENIPLFQPLVNAMLKNPKRAEEFYNTTGEYQTGSGKINTLNTLVSEYAKQNNDFYKSVQSNPDYGLVSSEAEMSKKAQERIAQLEAQVQSGDLTNASTAINEINALYDKRDTLRGKITPEVLQRAQEVQKQLTEKQKEQESIKKLYTDYFKNDIDVAEYTSALQEREKNKEEDTFLNSTVFKHLQAFSIGVRNSGIKQAAPIVAALKAKINGTDTKKELVKLNHQMEIDDVILGNKEVVQTPVAQVMNTIGQIIDAAGFVSSGGGGTIATAGKSFIYGFSSSFFDNYTQALQTNNNPKAALLEGSLRSTSTGLSEIIFNEAKLFKGIRNIPDLIKGGKITYNAALNLIQNGVNDSIEEVADQIGQMSVDVAKDYLAEGQFNKTANKEYFQQQGKEALNTIAVTMASSMIVGLPANISYIYENKKNPESLLNSAFIDMASNAENYNSTIENIQKSVQKNYLTKEEGIKAIEKLTTYRETFKTLENLQANNETKSDVLASTQIILQNGTDKNVTELNDALFEIAVNETPEKVQEAIDNMVNIANDIQIKEKRALIEKRIGVNKPNEENTIENSLTEISPEVENIKLTLDKTLPDEHLNLQASQQRLTTIEEKKATIDERIQNQDQYLATKDENSVEYKQAEQHKNSLIEEKQNLLIEQDILQEQIPLLQKKADDFDLKNDEENKKPVESTETKPSEKTETDSGTTTQTSTDNGTNSTDNKLGDVNDVIKKLDTIESDFIAKGRTEKEARVLALDSISDAERQTLRDSYNQEKNQKKSDRITEIDNILYDSQAAALEAKKTGVSNSSTLTPEESETLRNERDNLKKQIENTTSNGTNKTDGKKDGENQETEREVLDNTKNPIGEKNIEVAGESQTTSSQADGIIEAQPIRKSVSDIEDEIINDIINKNPGITVEQAQEQAQNQFDESVSRGEVKAHKTKEFGKKQLAKKVKNRIENNKFSPSKRASLRASKKANKKQKQETQTVLENLKQGLLEAEKVVEQQEIERKSQLPMADIPAFFDLFSLFKKNPIYFADRKGTDLDKFGVELRHSINSMVINMSDFIHSNFSVLNKNAITQTDEQRKESLAVVKSMLYNQMKTLVKNTYGIELGPIMKQVPISNYDLKTEEGINGAINNYVYSVIEELTKLSNNPDGHYLAFFEDAKNITQANINNPTFLSEAAIILRNITNESPEDIIISDIEVPIDPQGESRDVTHNNESVPEANIINIFYTEIKKLLQSKHGLSNSFSINELLKLMFHSFENPYDAISFAKNSTGLDPISTTIVKEVGLVMERFIDNYMGEDQLNPNKLIYINNELRRIFENKPRNNVQTITTNTGLVSRSINIGNSQSSIIQELASNLYQAKISIKDNEYSKQRYEQLWLDSIKNPEESLSKILDIIDMFQEVGNNNSVNVGLLNEMFSRPTLEYISENKMTTVNDSTMFNNFLLDIFSPVEQDLRSSKFVMLSEFINYFHTKKLNGGHTASQNKIYNPGVRQNENATARPNVLTVWLDKLNILSQKIKVPDGSNFISEVINKTQGTVLAKFFSNYSKHYNIHNPYFDSQQILNNITEAEIHSIKNDAEGNNANSVQKVSNANKEQRLLVSLSSFWNSYKYNTNWFNNLFMPSNKPKIKAHRVPMFTYNEETGTYNYGKVEISGTQEKPGKFENFINAIIGDTKLSATQIQEWLPLFYKVTKNNAGKLEVIFDKSALEKQAHEVFQNYIQLRLATKVNFLPYRQTGAITSIIPIMKLKKQIMDKITANPETSLSTIKGLIKQFENNTIPNQKILPKEFLGFLKSLEKDELLISGSQFFQDYLFNTMVNQQFFTNTFVAPINVLVEAGETPRNFYYNRVNQLTSPGNINHLGRDENYAIVKFNLEDGYETNKEGKKVLVINDVDTNGNPIRLEIPFAKLDGTEFVTEQYSIDTTIGVGFGAKILGNLKKATMGMNNQGELAIHKNMSVVITKSMIQNNPIINSIYNYMLLNNLDKIVTTDGSKSLSEKQNPNEATLKNGELIFDSKNIVKSISSENTVVQLPVNLTLQDENQNTRQNKLSTQLVDQLVVMMGDKAPAILEKIANVLKNNNDIGNLSLRRFSDSINELQNTVFKIPNENDPTIEEYNNRIAQKRGELITNLINVFETYSKDMKERIGKEASAKFNKVLENLKTNVNNYNPTNSFETDIQGITEIFNDIVRTSQSVWIEGGWHSLVSDFTLGNKELKFKDLGSGKYEGEVMIGREAAMQLGLKAGDNILLQKLPFNNMATKFFATVKIGPVSGSSMAMPSEWLAITSSDTDGDAVASLKIDLNYQQVAEEAIRNIDPELLTMSTEEGKIFLQNNPSALIRYLRAKTAFDTQSVLNDMRNEHLNPTNNRANLMQLQQVTTELWENGANNLKFTEPTGNINNPLHQADRGGSTQMTQEGIGIIASSDSALLRMGYTNTNLPNSSNIEITYNNEVTKLGRISLTGETGNYINEDGSSVIDKMSNFLQIMVDSFKNNYSEKLGINKSNVLHALFLNIANVSEEKILTIINQPIFKLYSLLSEQSRNKILQSNLRSYSEINYLRQTMVDLVKERGLNNVLLSKLGYVSDNGDFSFRAVAKTKFEINIDKIKSSYQRNGNTQNITNSKESIDSLVRQLETMDNTELEAQVETMALLISAKDMVANMEKYITIRKKFQTGFTDPQEIPNFEAKLVNMGIMSSIGSDKVEKSLFEHRTLSLTEQEKVKSEIAKIESTINRLDINRLDINAPGTTINNYLKAGFNNNSLREFLMYQKRMLVAANVNNTWVNTFYVGDPVFRQQVDNFFTGVAQTSTLMPIINQERQASEQKEIQTVTDGNQSVVLANKKYNYSLLKKARNVIFNHFFDENSVMANDPGKKANLLNEFQLSMSNMLETFYRYKSEFPQNKFMQFLEMVSNGSSVPVNERFGKPIYTNTFHLYLENTEVPIEANEIISLGDKLGDIVGNEIKSSYDSIVNNTETTMSVKNELFQRLMDSLTKEQAESNGLSLSSLQFLLTLDYKQNTEYGLPIDIVIHENNIYDAGSGFPIFGNSKTMNLFMLPEDNNSYDDDFVLNEANELGDLRTSINFGIDSIRQMLHQNSKDESGNSLANTYMNLIHNYIESRGGDRALSTMYRKGVDSKIQLSTDPTNQEEIKNSLETIGDDLVKTISVIENDEINYTSLDEVLLSDSSVSSQIIIDSLRNGTFADIYGLYFSMISNNFSSWAKIKPILSSFVNMSMLSEQNEMVKSKTNDMPIEELLINSPTSTKKIEWNDIQNADILDYSKYPKEYYHTIDPDGNVVLFKKVVLVQDSKQTLNYKNIETEKADKKTSSIGLFFPIGYYTTDQNNNYILTNTTTGNPIETLNRIDLSSMNNQKIVKILSGLIMANETNNVPENFNIGEFQEQIRVLAGLTELQTPNPTEIKRRLVADTKLKIQISNIIGGQNYRLFERKAVMLLDFINTASKLDQNRKLFQNSIFAAEPTVENQFTPFDTKVNKEAFKDESNGATVRIYKTIRASAKSTLSRVKSWSSPMPYIGTVREYLSVRNKGEMPKTFRDLVLAISTDINSDPSFSYVTNLLVNKIGNEQIEYLSDDAYRNLETSAGFAVGSTNMVYDSTNKKIIMNQDTTMDFVNHPEAILHEGIHALTLDMFQTNPMFKNDVLAITNQFKSQWNDVFTNNWKTRNEGLASIIQDNIIDETNPDIAAEEFLAYSLSTREATFFKLLNQLRSGNNVSVSGVKNNLWTRFVTSIVKHFGEKVNNKALLGDLLNLMDTYYETMGVTSPTATRTIGNDSITINGKIFKDTMFTVNHYLSNQGKDFLYQIQNNFKAITGLDVTNANRYEQKSRETEINMLKNLIYKAKNDSQAANDLNIQLQIVSPEAKFFAKNLMNIIANQDYISMASVENSIDMQVAGFIDGTYFTNKEGAFQNIGIESVYVENKREYEQAQNSVIFQQEERFGKATFNNLTQAEKPSIKAVMNAAVIAYIKEGQGFVVDELKIHSVDTNGIINTYNIPFAELRPYIKEMLIKNQSAIGSNVRRIQNLSDGTMQPNMSDKNASDIINAELHSIQSTNINDAKKELFDFKSKKIDSSIENKTQAKMLKNYYKNLMEALIDNSYKTYNKNQLAIFETTSFYLKESGFLSDETFNYVLQEYMYLAQNMMIQEQALNNRNTPSEMVDLTTFGAEKLMPLFVPPTSWSLYKKQLSDIFYKMNQYSDNIITEASKDRYYSNILWNNILKERGLLKKWSFTKNIPLQQEQEILNLFSKPSDLMNGALVFKTTEDLNQQAPLTMAEKQFYDFVSTRMETLLNELYSTQKVNGNPIITDSYIGNFFGNTIDPDTGLQNEEKELLEIPIPAVGTKYRSQLADWLHIFKGENKDRHQTFVQQQQLKAFGNKIVSYLDDNNDTRTMTVREWEKYAASLNDRTKSDKLIDTINNIARGDEQAGNIKKWIPLSKMLNIRSFVQGRDINNREVGQSFDLNYMFTSWLDEIHGLRVGNTVSSFSDALNYTIDNTIESEKEKSLLSKYFNEFIQRKYFNEQRAKTDTMDKRGKKVIEATDKIATMIALGWNASSQIADMFDVVRVFADSDANKTLKGIKVAMKLLATNPPGTQSANRLTTVINGLKNIDTVKRLYAIDNTFLLDGKYESNTSKAADKILESMYTLYKFNDYIRTVSIIAGELGETRFMKIYNKIATNVEITKEEKDSMNRAIDVYVGLMGAQTKSTSVIHDDNLSRQTLKYKRWVFPAFNTKYGLVGANSGTYKNKPVYSTEAMIFSRFLNNKLGGNTVFKLSERNENALNSYTPDEIASIHKSLMKNAALAIMVGMYMYFKYWEDDEDESNIWKNHKEAMKYRPLDYMIGMAILGSCILGAPILAIFAGLAIINLSSNLFDVAVSSKDYESGHTKYNSKSGEMIKKFTPIGRLVELFAGNDYFLSEKGIHDRQKFEEKHSFEEMIKRIKN